MIPLKDTAPSERFPIVNIMFIMLNVVIFGYQQTLDPQELYRLIHDYGSVPYAITEGLGRLLRGAISPAMLSTALFPLLTANFLHGSWLHLIGNMIYLWVFGDNIESRLGHLGYLIIYLAMGALSQFWHIFANPFSTVPLVGASGAIAGVLGAYFMLYPRSQVLTLVPLGFFITLLRIPSVILLAFWFALQLINALAAQGQATGIQPVAWWAHVGGFAIGVIVGLVAKKGTYSHT